MTLTVGAAQQRRHRDSPRVRRLARERSIDVTAIAGTGPGGRVTVADLHREMGPQARVEPMTASHRVQAEQVLASLRVAAQLTTVVEVDLTRATAHSHHVDAHPRGETKAASVAFASVAEAAVQALLSHPTLNARVDSNEGVVTYPAGVHLGVAVDSEQGRAIPVVRDAQDLSVDGLARRIAHAVERARSGDAVPEELVHATFTITDAGSDRVLFETPVIIQPQSAILALGAVVRRPTVVTGADGSEMLAVRSMAYLSLTYDHRLVDGADAARYLTAVKNRLESHTNARYPSPDSEAAT